MDLIQLIQTLDRDWLLAFQAVPGLQGVMAVFTFLGNEEFFLFVMPLVYWCLDAAAGGRLAVLLVASNGLSNLLKLGFARPRPYWVDERALALSRETSYSLPSSHALNATTVWGYLAVQLRRGWATAAAVILIGLISLSRTYLGMHFPTNLLAGWLFGGLLLWAYARWEPPAAAWLARQGLGPQIGLALAASLLYLGLAAGLLTLVPAPADLPAWAAAAERTAPGEAGEPAIDPRGWASHVTAAGMILGLGVGLSLAARGARFDAGGPWLKRAARFVVGVLGVGALFLGLRALLPGGDDVLGQVLRYLRYALIVVWALYAAPWVFLRLRLADPR
mgnify:CR=1 FL=1